MAPCPSSSSRSATRPSRRSGCGWASRSSLQRSPCSSMAKCPLGRPPARPLRLLGARLVALGGVHSRGASQATGRPPPPRVLELATHFPAVDPSGAAADPGRMALLGGDRRPAAHGDAERHRLHHRLLGLRLHVDERLPTARRRRREPSRGRVRQHGQIGLQPGIPTVAAWDTYGCSLAWGSVRPHGQSAPVAGPQLASSASSGRACRLWAACTPRGRGQPTGRPATAFHRRRLTAPPSAMQVRLRAQPRLVPRHTDADRLRAAAT